MLEQAVLHKNTKSPTGHGEGSIVIWSWFQVLGKLFIGNIEFKGWLLGMLGVIDYAQSTCAIQ